MEDFLPVAERSQASRDFWEPAAAFSAESSASPKVIPIDFWDTTRLLQHRLPFAAPVGFGAVDFWDPLPITEREISVLIEDWSEGIALPAYEASAFENPFAWREAPRSREGISRCRSRWLASLLDLPTARARRWFADRFEELFDEFPHRNTFRVLSELALEGESGDEILTAFQLRQVWADNPIFWSIRRKGLRRPIVPDAGERQLGWTRAIRLANLAKGLPAERIIDHDWYEEWVRLHYGDPLFWSFLEYVTERLESFSRGVLALPETLARLEARTLDELTAGQISIDGMKVGSFARTGSLIRLATDQLSSSYRKVEKPEAPDFYAEAAE